MKIIKWSLLFIVIIAVALAGEINKPYIEDELALSKSYLVVFNLNHHIITSGQTGSEKLVALTFDDGPDPQYTPQVLAILKKYNVKATFFVVGEECQAHPELVRREIDEGHEVENHTFTHPDLVRDNGISTEEEILRTGKAIEQITGRKPVYFRPPKRLFTHETVDIADADGYQIVLWTIGVEHKESKTIKDMADRVIKADKPGMIILAHDGRLNRTKTVKALPLVIKGYQSMGYRFVTVHELLTYKPKSGAVKLNPSRIHLCTAI